LSLLHADDYPFVTSRDTTAAGFVSEAGLSPLDVDEIVLVIRAFPIRVPGNSGPLPNEIDWNEVSRISGTGSIEERTSVTDCVRRVARFDPRVVQAAIEVNQPTKLVLNHVDYVDSHCRDLCALTPKAANFVKEVESKIDRSIDLVGFDRKSLYPPDRISNQDREAEPSLRI